MIEVLVATALALVVALAVYDFLDHGNRAYVRESDLAEAQNAGRVALEVFASDVRVAGYSPLGSPFYAVPAGDASRVRLLADLDGDGDIGVPGETGENLSYIFSGPDGDGLYELTRGYDRTEDWDFEDSGEDSSNIASRLVPIDLDGDGTDDPFLSYVIPPPASPDPYDPEEPATSQLTITFGVRSGHRDMTRKSFSVVPFQTTVSVRNR